MPTPKKNSVKKPSLSADFKKKLGGRLEQVQVKVGFVNALEIKLTNEQLSAIMSGVEQMEAFDKYFDIPDQGEWGTELVACVIQTFGEEDEAFEPVVSDKMKKSMMDQGLEVSLIQHIYWRVKCEATPNNALMVWMGEEQYADLEYEGTYIFIGILQKQWSVATGETSKGGKKIYKNYQSEDQVPEGKTSWETHSLKLVDFIG